MTLNILFISIFAIIFLLFLTFFLFYLSSIRSNNTKSVKSRYNDVLDDRSDEQKSTYNKCCLIYDHTCFENGACKHGIEKRCGEFYRTPCDKTLVECEKMTSEQCNLYPNNVHCTNALNGECVHREGVFGEQVNCTSLHKSHGYNEIGCNDNVPSNSL